VMSNAARSDDFVKAARRIFSRVILDGRFDLGLQQPEIALIRRVRDGDCSLEYRDGISRLKVRRCSIPMPPPHQRAAKIKSF